MTHEESMHLIADFMGDSIIINDIRILTGFRDYRNDWEELIRVWCKITKECMVGLQDQINLNEQYYKFHHAIDAGNMEEAFIQMVGILYYHNATKLLNAQIK